MRTGKTHTVRIEEGLYEALRAKKEALGLMEPMNTFIERVLTGKVDVRPGVITQGLAQAKPSGSTSQAALLHQLLEHGEIYVKLSCEVLAEKPKGVL